VQVAPGNALGEQRERALHVGEVDGVRGQ
jgi:hypothetical protein